MLSKSNTDNDKFIIQRYTMHRKIDKGKQVVSDKPQQQSEKYKQLIDSKERANTTAQLTRIIISSNFIPKKHQFCATENHFNLSVVVFH